MAHRTPGRVRIKIPGQRKNATYFANLRRRLVQHDGIVSVDVDARTASVLIKHRAGFQLSALSNPFIGLAIADPDMRPPAHARLARRIAHVDGPIRRLAGGEADLALVVFKLTVAAITRQAGWQIVEWIAEAILRAVIKSLAPRVQHTPGALAARPVSMLPAAG